MNEDLAKIRSVANYQFGRGAGARLFPNSVQIAYSQNTGRIRYVYLDGKRLATMRPTDGLFSLSLDGAKRTAEMKDSARCFVTVNSEVTQFITDGSDVFAAHVVDADGDLRAKDEVVVVDENHKVLAVGRAMLSAGEMRAFKRGVAVKVRRGDAEES